MKRTLPWLKVGTLVLLASALAGTASAYAQEADKTSPTPFAIGVDVPADAYAYKWLNRIYTEAFRRLGMAVQLESYGLKRQGLQIEHGNLDAEADRAIGYGATQPHLVRVEESIIDLQLALFTGNPSVHLQRLEDLASNDLTVEYRRGHLLCENTLKPLVPAERLSDLPTEEQAIKKILAHRTDLYCDFTIVIPTAVHAPDYKNGEHVRKVLDIGKPIATYPYLHQRHADLAPRLAAVLKAMKAEGLIETYRKQTERDVRASP